MAKIRSHRNNSLKIKVGISQDANKVGDLTDVENEKEYHVVEASHSRTEVVNLDIAGESKKRRLQFEREQKKDSDWSCQKDIPPKFVNGSNRRTDSHYASAKICHDDEGNQDIIETTVKNKLESAKNWANYTCDHVVNLV